MAYRRVVGGPKFREVRFKTSESGFCRIEVDETTERKRGRERARSKEKERGRGKRVTKETK